MTSQTVHIPVLAEEVKKHFDIKKGGRYLDATFGGGGHTRIFLEKAGSTGQVVAFDLNPSAIELGQSLQQQARQKKWGELILMQANFSQIAEQAKAEQWPAFDGVLFDLGLSSDLLASDRGFSSQDETSLQMLFGGQGEFTAADIVNLSDQEDLVFIFSNFGEERFSKTIAEAIVQAREDKEIQTGAQLAAIIKQAVPDFYPFQKSVARIFQALRIVVNQEFNNLTKGIEGAVQVLKPGGRVG